MSLEVKGLTKAFGGLRALDDLTMVAEPGAVTGLIGPNGAGKTTFFNAIGGFLKPDAGEVLLDGRDIRGLSPLRIARLGVARSFQELRLFTRMSVADQILLSVERSVIGSSRADRARVDDIIETVGLEKHRGVLASALSYGQQKHLSLARLMGMQAKVWLLDEPASGLDHNDYETFRRLVRQARDSGVTVVLIEHNLDLVRELADVVTFLDRGRALASGSVSDVLGDPEVQTLYFGQRDKDVQQNA